MAATNQNEVMKEFFSTGMDGYMGGKAAPGTIRLIANEIPPHRLKLSGFLGNCAITRFIRPAEINVGVEIDKSVFQTWFLASVSTDELQIINKEFLQAVVMVIDDLEDEFVFLDPPYHWSTRTAKRYTHDMNHEQHVQLLKWCQSVKSAKVMICNYPNELYDQTLAGWRTVEYEAMTRGGYTKTEKIWMNYDKPKALHDSRFIGKGFREREKLKRRRQTVFRKVKRMSEVERLALFDQLRDEFPDCF